MRTNKIVQTIILIVLAAAAIWIFTLIIKPQKAVVGENGEIRGNYSMENIMALGAPYRCSFGVAEESAQIAGTMLTDGQNMYGEFRMSTSLVEDQFNTFLLVRGKTAYIWTSLYPFGYQTRAADSATRNASPEEQSQIIGRKDKLDYDCTPWQNPEPTVFEAPSWITFSEV